MKLSIIIPSFNAGKTISQQLDALKEQKWNGRWEIIIADNGSTDNTIDIVKMYQNLMPGIRIVSAKEKRGASYARNIGVRYAKGESIIFLDADDVVGENWLQILGNSLRDKQMVASRFEQEKLNTPATLEIIQSPQLNGLNMFRFAKLLPFAGACGLGVRRSVHEMIGGFDETLIAGEDIDYCWRAQLLGIELHFIQEAVVHIRLRGTTNGVFRQYIRNGEYSIPIYKKYRNKGIEHVSLKQGLLQWHRLIRKFLNIRSKKGYVLWLREFGYRIGIIKGSIKNGVFKL